MSILEEIIAYKSLELKKQREFVPIKDLEKSHYFHRKTISMKAALQREDKVGIIAEIKRSSPSQGVINHRVDVEKLTKDYLHSGASALSVLTDYKYFGGTIDDLKIARKNSQSPILRKEFIIDEYQLIQSKSIGADCILLIASAISEKRCKQLARFAKKIGLEIVLEVHSKKEIESHLSEEVDIVGVNNRNLHNFTTSIQQSIELATYIPDEYVKISESGIRNASSIIELTRHGFEGFLIGTHFMNHAQPELACEALVHEVLKMLAS